MDKSVFLARTQFIHMKKHLLLNLILFSVSGSYFAQETISPNIVSPARGGMIEEIPCGFTPEMNGVEQPDEWLPANYIPMMSATTTMVGMMHDETHLYFIFSGHLESQIQFPEIYIDVNNSKDSTWQADDWWFHVSATDCDNMGSPDVYTNCQEVQPDWLGVNNIQPGSPVVDTVEIAIPFSKIGYNYGSGDPMGIAFGLNNVMNNLNIYPQGGNLLIPATWLTVTILPCNAGIVEQKEKALFVYPNPTNGEFTVRFEDETTAGELVVYAMNGQRVAAFELSGSASHTVTLPLELESGTYLMEVNSETTIHRQIVELMR